MEDICQRNEGYVQFACHDHVDWTSRVGLHVLLEHVRNDFVRIENEDALAQEVEREDGACHARRQGLATPSFDAY